MMRQTMKKRWTGKWRQRLAAVLIPLLMVLAMAGVGVGTPVQAAEKSPFPGCRAGVIHSCPVGRQEHDL